MNSIQVKVMTKIGPLYLVASAKGLRGIFWSRQPFKLVDVLNRNDPQEKILDAAREQLEEYFAGKRKKFELPLDLDGTRFQKKVWKALAQIPFGQTLSYRDVAQKIRNPKAMRAVGSANGKNPVCIIIPCHRVIAADGSIGGYTGGIHIKQQLLEHEQQ